MPEQQDVFSIEKSVQDKYENILEISYDTLNEVLPYYRQFKGKTKYLIPLLNKYSTPLNNIKQYVSDMLSCFDFTCYLLDNNVDLINGKIFPHDIARTIQKVHDEMFNNCTIKKINTDFFDKNAEEKNKIISETMKKFEILNTNIKKELKKVMDIFKAQKPIDISSDQENILKKAVKILDEIATYFKDKDKKGNQESLNELKSYSKQMLSWLDFVDDYVLLNKALKDDISKTIAEKTKILKVKTHKIDPGTDFFKQTKEQMKRDIDDFIQGIESYNKDSQKELEKMKKISE